jgi:hypothetical protein
MRIFALVPGGQTLGNSPSEILMKEVAKQKPDWTIYLYNTTFDTLDVRDADFRGIDLVWVDMDGGNVINIGAYLKRKYGMKLYAHGEWVPPYRVFDGYSDIYKTKTDLSFRDYYLEMLKSMSEADLVSFGLPSHSLGSFDWVKEKFGIEFENYFVRHNYVKRYPHIAKERTYSVATIARPWDTKKRILDTAKAISFLNPIPEFKIIGAKEGDVTSPVIKVNCLGVFDDDSKVDIYRTSRVAVQHWSGIPPAEAMTQLCPVVAYRCEEMEYDYGDSIIWAEDLEDLAFKLSYVFNSPEIIAEKVIENYRKLENSELKINYVDIRAREVISKLEGIL